MKSAAFESAEGWRVRLEFEGRVLESHAYENKLCAEASAEQTKDLLGRADKVGYASQQDFVDKLVSLFGWGETMAEGEEKETEGSAIEYAIKLKVKQENEVVLAMLKTAQDFVVYDQQGLDIVEAVLLDVKARWNIIEAERKRHTAPHNKKVKAYNTLFNGPLHAYAMIETILKQKVLDAKMRAKQAQDAAMLAAQQAHQVGDRHAVAVATHAVYQADIHHTPGVSTRPVWAYRIVSLPHVPREFLMVNDSAIKAYIKATDGQMPIAGIEIYADGIVSVRPS